MYLLLDGRLELLVRHLVQHVVQVRHYLHTSLITHAITHAITHSLTHSPVYEGRSSYLSRPFLRTHAARVATGDWGGVVRSE